MMPPQEHLFVIMVGQRCGDTWLETLAFNDAFVDRQDAESELEGMLKLSSFTRMETSIRSLRVIPKQQEVI